MLKKIAVFILIVFCVFLELTLIQEHKKAYALEINVEDLNNINNQDEKTFEEEINELTNETEEIIENESIEKIEKVEEIVDTTEKEEKVLKTEDIVVKTEVPENKEVKTEVINKKEEVIQEAPVVEPANTVTTAVTVEYPDNCLVIGNNVIQIKIAPATQGNINSYDVVQDNADVSTYDNIVLFGHNYKSFRCLKSVRVGETIKLSNYGKIEEYVVFRSERGINSSDGTEIYSENDGKELVYTYHGYDETLKLITCDGNQRWVISAYKTV